MKKMSSQKPNAQKPRPVEGMLSRRIACDILTRVLLFNRPLDEAFELIDEADSIDRGFVRAICLETLRRHGSLNFILDTLTRKELPEGLPRLKIILLSGLTQVLFMDVAPHAALNVAVEMVKRDSKAKGLAGFINAVLRKALTDKETLLANIPPLADIPMWLQNSWKSSFGEEKLNEFAKILRYPETIDLHLVNPNDFTGFSLPNGAFRLETSQNISLLDGFATGEFFVQNAAAQFPVQFLKLQQGESALDLCAAPGGKTMQMALAGAKVTALDRSKERLKRLSENLDRMNLKAQVITGDAGTFESPTLFDAILLDAPCSATGTMRSNPDVAWLKSEKDVLKLAKIQRDMLINASKLLKKGGRLVLCTCSLQQEEGEAHVEWVKANFPALTFSPIEESEAEGLVTNGCLRTTFSDYPHENPRLAGLDGFFAARFMKS